MRQNPIFSKLAFLIVLLCLGTAGAAAQSVTGSITGGAVTRGARSSGSVILTIPAGLHVNSSRPSSEYAEPTVVRLSASGVKVSGPTYPRGTDRKFQFSESLINVYEGRVRFPFTVTVPKGFRGNSVSVKAVVRYQACTDEVCYRPQTVEITMRAKVR